MRTKQICRYIAFTAILTTSGCSLVGPKCQRIKLSDIFSVKNKNVVVVEYDKDGVCRPTVAGHQQVVGLKYKNPNETYFWNYKQCKWITKSEHEQIIDDAFDSIELPVKKQQ